MRKLEVIATTVNDAMNAQIGGASSVEIVQNLAVGGLTPPLDVVRAIRDSTTLRLRVILRPHAQGFRYSRDDIDLMLKDIDALKQIGIDGIVFGALREDSSVDLVLTTQIAQVVSPLELTFHRAIDASRDAPTALPALKGIVQRILTSGQADTVWAGRSTIRGWVERFGRDFTFACGGGIRTEHIEDIVRATDAPEYHVGTAAQTDLAVDAAKVQDILRRINFVE